MAARNAIPDFYLETELHRQGYGYVAGLDEVGRGCLAGPAAAGAVILPRNPSKEVFALARDSKQLSAAQREEAYEAITASALSYAVGWSTPVEIDRTGIAAGVRRAMRRALEQLNPPATYLLIDRHFSALFRPAAEVNYQGRYQVADHRGGVHSGQGGAATDI